ncbi:hypothetical protein FHX74_000140 [Friedmanniella endophytica]|uniref:Major facilitator superfamily (MFS) profile domain-containing protein n=1 Tax=Microlunatus kandeliicorticis TaxID=1759536 RepID=A0A7W3INX8_9ACTN|nr:MFS transporter [Microlunatus kandeliicorticis]MBA8792546.1 hypothetical protein [Microlunatus kandeliicorticis]
MTAQETDRDGPSRAGERSPTARAAWRLVVGLGVTSLAADMVYEGARSVYGPLLASLGAGATLVGLVGGVGEAVALVARLFTGARADRSGRYWGWTLAGYLLTALSVPLLAVTPWLGGAGLAAGVALILLERFGKAVRSPAKTVLLARASQVVGLGRGFGVHKALDQLGAVAGPLLVAGLAALTGGLATGLATLAVPGAVSVAVVLVLRARDRGADRAPGSAPARPAAPGPVPGTTGGLPRTFWLYAITAALSTAGLVSWAVIGYHLVQSRLVGAAAVPVLYAVAMGAGGLAALAAGPLYDRWHGRILLALPVLVIAVPLTAFGSGLPVVVAGVVVWGAATGLQDSTVKALVADQVEPARRGTAYGLFAAVQGGAAVLGGLVAGALSGRSLPALVGYVVATQVVGALVLLWVLRRSPQTRTRR